MAKAMVFCLRPHKLIGCWYGEHVFENDTKQKWLANRKQNGTLTIHFELYENDMLSFKVIEHGRWGASDSVQTDIIDEIEYDGQKSTPQTEEGVYVEKYKILKLKDSLFLYKHESEGIEFKAIRVPDDFQL